MRLPLIALAILVVGAGGMSSCGIGWVSSSSPEPPASEPPASAPPASAPPASAPATSAPAVDDPSGSVRLYHDGDRTVAVIFEVFGEGRAEISYTLHAGDAPTLRTVATPWTHTFQVAVNEPGLSPTLTARNTDPTATIGCRIMTSQLAMSGDTPVGPHAVAHCSTKIRSGP